MGNFYGTILMVMALISTASAKELYTSEDRAEVEKIIEAKVPAGPLKGQTLNTSVRRPLYVLGAGESTEKLNQLISADTVTLANFFHDGQFYVARIPIKSIEVAHLLTAPFSPVASHTMLRFSLRAGEKVQLIGRLNGPNMEPMNEPLELRDVVITIDGTESKTGKAWNLVDAIRGRYTLAYRMVSIQERFKWFILNGTPIEQTKLNLSAEEAQKTLRMAIYKSHTLGFSARYSLITANCTNLALKLIKDANPMRERDFAQSHPWSARVRDVADRYTSFADAFTQFTQLKIGLLNWVESNEIDLQKDPEFKEEIKRVISEYRNNVDARKDYSWAEKDALARQMGLQTDALLEDPRQFKAALKDYKKMLNLEQSLQNARMCKNVF
jgi:hypothetical protein